jgi:hypothetical protein
MESWKQQFEDRRQFAVCVAVVQILRQIHDNSYFSQIIFEKR